ncbi:MAG: SET domain-containing protein [Actinomycetota bacterium]
MTLQFNRLTPLARAEPMGEVGWGSRAVQPIPRGIVVATFGGDACDRRGFDAMPATRRERSIQVDDNLYIVGPPEREPGDAVNHSCDPNCGPRNATQIVAWRDITPGEVLTFDYGTTDGSDYDQFPCSCGASLCRGQTSSDDWRRIDLQQRYGLRFSPYLLRRIDAASRARTLSKAERVSMLATYDTAPIAALTTALRLVSGRPHARFADVIHASHLSLRTKHALCDGDTNSRDDLIAELNEFAGESFVTAVSPL